MFVDDGPEGSLQCAFCETDAQELFHEQRIALAHAVEPFGLDRRARDGPRRDFVGGEARQRQHLGFAPNLCEQRAQLWIRRMRLTSGAHDEHAHAAELARDEQEQQERRHVRDVQIVQQDQPGRVARCIREGPGRRIEENETLARVRSEIQLPEGIAPERPKDLRPRPKCRRASRFPAATPSNRDPALPSPRLELSRQAGLSDTSLAGQDDQRAVSLLGAPERRLEAHELARPAEKPVHGASVSRFGRPAERSSADRARRGLVAGGR